MRSVLRRSARTRKPRTPRAPFLLVAARRFFVVGALVAIELPLRLESESNKREHWSTKARRTKRARGLVATYLRPKLNSWKGAPLLVEVTRLAPSRLDGHDNLAASCKACVDGIADALGLASDDDPRIGWAHRQETAGVRTYGVRIVVREVCP